MELKDLGERMRQAREEKGLSRQELADALGLSYGAIAKYEGGEREPGSRYLIQLADYLNCSVDYLLCRPGISQSEAVLIEAYNTADPHDRRLAEYALRLSEKMEIS